MKIISGSSNPELTKEICRVLGKNPSKINIKKFSDGEIYIKLEEDVRGRDVFIVQSTNSNDNIMELLIIIDAAKRASAKRITAVMPYFGYARQDRKAEPREPITAKLMANLITKAGADRVVTIDLHTPQIQGFFDIPLDDMWAHPIFVKHFKKNNPEKMVIVSPDAGGMKRALFLSKRLNCSIAMIDKRRSEHNTIDEMKLVGEVKGKTAIIYDDIIDTAGTITRAAKAVKEAGAKEIYICAAHPVFSGNAIEKLTKSEANKIYVSNTLPVKETNKIKILDIGRMVAIAIKNIHENKSVSAIVNTFIEEDE